MAAREDGFDAGEGGFEDAVLGGVGDEGAHFAGHFADLAGEEAFVFEVDAGGAKEVLAVEIGADADLDAFEAGHEEDGALRAAAELEEDVAAGLVVADEGGLGVVVVFQDGAAGVGLEPGGGLGGGVEIIAGGGLEAGVAEGGLAEGAVVFEAVAEGAAAEHAVALGAEFVLLGADADAFEEDHAVVGGAGADPVEFGVPVAGAGE